MYRLLSHNDLDGVGCGILAKLALGREVSVRYNSVSGLDREVEYFLDHGNKGTFLFITDLSVNEKNETRLESFYQEGGKVQFIDHHKTSLHFNEYDWGHVAVEDDVGKLNSATSLFYDYLVEQQLLQPSKALTEFVELIRQYDTWEWEANGNEQAKRLNSLFFLLSIHQFEEMMIERLSISDRFYFDDFETKLLDMEDDKIIRYIRRKRRELIQKQVHDYYAGIVHAESYHSELGNELGKTYPHLDYIVILNLGAKRVGFRTIHDDVDVSDVASTFGGGGHAKASGCSLTDEAYQLFVAESFPLKPLPEDAYRNRYNVKESSFGTLYQNREEDWFFLYPARDGQWVIEKNQTKMPETFATFTDAEKFLKRQHEVGLARDDIFVHFLMKHYGKEK
ncbi:DHH family phosphoesterase [Oceanobacillus halotolerans]|uniref:DHH family phosphoesterase n=1 Tax=Oceanobacillus halotolerans TaxID=2663380 RepID=UPI0013DB3FE8|nr:oligoribonuclease [Oceanobacillus halotolerans]